MNSHRTGKSKTEHEENSPNPKKQKLSPVPEDMRWGSALNSVSQLSLQRRSPRAGSGPAHVERRKMPFYL